jgi:serine/threonine protein phosphatase PrpC
MCPETSSPSPQPEQAPRSASRGAWSSLAWRTGSLELHGDELYEAGRVAFEGPEAGAIKGSWALVSVRGCVRDNNEDHAGCWTEGGEAPLFAVADGLGGHAAGEVASMTAVGEAIKTWSEGSREKPRQLLRQAARAANAQVYGASLTQGCFGMATTFTAASFEQSEVVVAHVGDSRAYLIHQGVPEQLTVDHTQVGEMMRIGLLTPEQAANHPARSVLTKCMGNAPGITVELSRRRVFSGDILVLCSDGLWSLVSKDEMAKRLVPLGLRGEVDPAEVSDASWELVERAVARGAPDNVTLIVVAIESLEAEAGGLGDKKKRRFFPFSRSG